MESWLCLRFGPIPSQFQVLPFSFPHAPPSSSSIIKQVLARKDLSWTASHTQNQCNFIPAISVPVLLFKKPCAPYATLYLCKLWRTKFSFHDLLCSSVNSILPVGKKKRERDIGKLWLAQGPRVISQYAEGSNQFFCLKFQVVSTWNNYTPNALSQQAYLTDQRNMAREGRCMADAWPCSDGLSLLQDESTDLAKASPQLGLLTDFQEAY